MGAGLEARGVGLTYPRASKPALRDVSIAIEQGKMTAVVGPNACGKSTLLRAFGRILRPTGGLVTLEGTDIAQFGSKQFARFIGLLPQSAIAPEGITVSDLVARGRFPHQGLLRQWSNEDEQAVHSAMRRTGIAELARRSVATLSGGQRQRVWIAMALAQQTDVLLLDEPTTFLDLTHQIEVLELCRELVSQGVTIVAVLHDLNQAARYADQVVAMCRGEVVASGSAAEVITTDTVQRVFSVACRIIPDPETGSPLVVPLAPRRLAGSD